MVDPERPEIRPSAMEPSEGTDRKAWVEMADARQLFEEHHWHQSLHRAASPELTRLSTDEMIERLPEGYQEQARSYQRQLGTLDPEFRRYICWAPDTPDAVVQTFRRIEIEGGMAPGELRIQANQFLGSGHWNRTALSGTNNEIQGQPVTLTWSIAPDGTNVPGLSSGTAGSDLIAWLTGIYGTNGGTLENEPWFPLFEEAFADISARTGLRFVYQSLDTGSAFSTFRTGSTNSRGDIRFGARALDGNSGTLAFAYAPDYGDIVFDSADSFFNNTTNNSIRFVNVLTHELGHALGLDHVCPINTTKLMEPFAATNFRGLQFDDTYSLQRQYGDVFEVGDTRTNNDAPSLSEVLQFTEETTSAWQWLSIDDNSDVDYFRITTAPNREVTIRVIPSDPVSFGTTYLEGAQNNDGSCTAGTPFDPTNRQNLTLELLAADGTTVLASSDAAPSGAGEEITAFDLPDGGSYFIRVNGDNANAAQLYRLELLVEALPDAPLVKIVGQTVIDESNVPANGFPDPGETIQLALDVTNQGGIDASNLQATLSGPASFTGFTTTTPATDLNAGGSGQWIFTFALDGNCGDTVDLTVDFSAANGYQSSATIEVTLGDAGPAAALSENFDEFPVLPDGWVGTTTGASQNWNITTANPNSGPRSAFGDSATSVGEAILTSPASLLGTGSSLTFRHSYDLESGYDGGVLEASLDGGPWFDLQLATGVSTSGGYNDIISGSYQSPIASREAWSGDSGGYLTVSMDLPPEWQGQSIRFRWISASDSSFDDIGWYLDDVELITGTSSCLPFRPSLSITANGNSLEEGNPSSTISGTISTPLPLARDLQLTLMTSGTADSDDLAEDLDLVLPSGSTSISFDLSAISDAETEGVEDLVIFIPNDQPGFTPSTSSEISLVIQEPQVTFATWANSFAGLNPSPEADDDGDRWSNLFEYAFNTDPLIAASSPIVTHQLTASTLSLDLPALDLPGDVLVTGETSTDLLSWDTEDVSQTASGFSVPRDGPQRYLRLRATLIP
ncbi:matrixin family metalloprotease [Haloferula rosea]|uniref:Matrixin family metalloprotease n=1 Tax=Haloferula rosea TaxID=490093 RepID=A0A934R8Q8_9BACT|nr:matrixin family metalloprotease [Haloferula rosea]MBK1826372.1 matrixin family metalloprotease [Haloferula rosea]